MNTIGYFEIHVADPSRATSFYGEIFGWKFIKQVGMPIDYWSIETADMRGGLLQRPSATPPPECGTNAFICSIQVADFDAIAAQIISHKGQVALPKFAVPGKCWQGYFLDTEGNTFGIFQVDEKAA